MIFYEKVYEQGIHLGYLITVIENSGDGPLLYESHAIVPNLRQSKSNITPTLVDPTRELKDLMIPLRRRAVDLFWDLRPEGTENPKALIPPPLPTEQLKAEDLRSIAAAGQSLPDLRRIATETGSIELRADIQGAIAFAPT